MDVQGSARKHGGLVQRSAGIDVQTASSVHSGRVCHAKGGHLQHSTFIAGRPAAQGRLVRRSSAGDIDFAAAGDICRTHRTSGVHRHNAAVMDGGLIQQASGEDKNITTVHGGRLSHAAGDRQSAIIIYCRLVRHALLINILNGFGEHGIARFAPAGDIHASGVYGGRVRRAFYMHIANEYARIAYSPSGLDEQIACDIHGGQGCRPRLGDDHASAGTDHGAGCLAAG